MKAYKGFNKDMTCSGFQYEEGKTYVTESANLCEEGFHACEDPIDCFSYYPPANSVFHEVKLEDVSNERDDDTKRVGKKITIGDEVWLDTIIKTGVKFRLKKCEFGGDSVTNGYQAGAQATGYQAVATAIGCESTAFADGSDAVAVAAGKDCHAKGTDGTLLVLIERGDWNGHCCPIIGAKTVRIDGKKYKPNTWYTLKNGKVVESE